MKTLVMSDIHGDLKYASLIPGIINREKIDRIILLGDLYASNYLNDDKEEVAKILNKYSSIIYAVRGNCDGMQSDYLSDFAIVNNLSLNINGKNFLFTHGHIFNEKNIPSGVDVLIFGHYHENFIIKKDNLIIANPGSLSIPRNGSNNSYMVIDDNKILLKCLDGTLIEESVFL